MIRPVEIDISDLKDAYGIWVTAEVFCDAGIVLGVRSNQYYNNPEKQLRLRIPVTVNLTFAVELYFKCLYYIENDSDLRLPGRDGHNLLKLFKYLSIQNQQLIIAKHRKLIESLNPVNNFPSEMPMDFISILEACKNAFVEFRYFYEGKVYTNYGIETIIDVIRPFIMELKPDWK